MSALLFFISHQDCCSLTSQPLSNFWSLLRNTQPKYLITNNINAILVLKLG